MLVSCLFLRAVEMVRIAQGRVHASHPSALGLLLGVYVSRFIEWHCLVGVSLVAYVSELRSCL